METNTLQIGQEIIIKDDLEIEGFGGNKILVKKGDKGYVDGMGFLHYQTGAARGKMQVIKDAVVKGYDYENIASMIYKRLQGEFNIKEYLEGYDIPVKDFESEIEWILSDIL